MELEVDFSPSYELLTSLYAYTQRQHHKSIDLGMDWVKSVDDRLGASAIRNDKAFRGKRALAEFHALYLLVRQCPDQSDATSFLKWLDAMPLGELYERLSFSMAGTKDVPMDIHERRQIWVDLLMRWNELYFQTVPEEWLTGLAAAAADLRERSAHERPEKVVEYATHGVRMREASENIRHILLVPQYHFSPWNIGFGLDTQFMYLYSVDLEDQPSDVPPKSLRRLTKALADDSRMKILWFLAEGPKRFADIVTFSGLTKGTVHHHLVALRAAGLVWVNTGGETETDTYELNLDCVDALSGNLRTYLQGGH